MSVASLYQLPFEILTGLVQYFDLERVCSFYPVSKFAQEIILDAATQKHIDFDLYLKDIEYKSEDLNSLLYLKIKIKKFTKNSMFFKSLNEVRAVPAFEKPKDVLALWGFATDSCAQMLAIVVFDYTTKKLTGPDLSIALHATVPNEESDSEDTDPDKAELIGAIFLHPNADQLAANALGSALGTAVAENNSGLIEKILNHPNAPGIQELDLLKLLESVQMSDNREFLERLEAHPIMQDVISCCSRPRKRRRLVFNK